MDKKSNVNRRGFLKQAGSVVAGGLMFPYVVPSSALGRDGAVSPGNRITMAAIGVGDMGTGDLQGFLNIPEVQVVALCDVDDHRTENAKNLVSLKYGNNDCRVYRDYRELLEQEKVDTVMHALPDHWHAIVSVACARKGIDMHGQKPLARTISQGREICDAVKRYGIIWQTGSWQRSVGHFRRACELVINGRIGKVNFVEVGLPNGNQSKDLPLLPVPDYFDWDMWLGPAPWRPYQDFGNGNCHWNWRWIMDYSGGQLTDWAGHHVDIAHWALGLDYTGPVEIEGQGWYPESGTWNTPYAYDFLCKYANGLEMRVANQGRLPKGMGTAWYGDAGWIHVNRGGLWASDPKILRERIGVNEIQLYKSLDHQRNFIDCVKSRKETVTPAEIAHRSISVGLLGEIAMLTGQKLKWDPEKEQFLNNDTANRYLSRAFRHPWHL
ncbi:MAG: Gfo/Idh/MocA family oxidoreductase [Sedimentisphaerales bacterium]|nr:Gfo/Idh/MocA family oxidoreductase [Sedimentisphaerales bacterium]